MKRWNYYLVFLLGISFSLFSCSSSEEEALPWFDFGEATYDEPFVGLLKSRPEFLVKSMQYPPYSWVAPDTVTFTKDLDITFNGECIRSKTEAVIQFRNSSYVAFDGITLESNGDLCENGELRLQADSLWKKVNLRLTISPVLGDSVFDGVVLIRGHELDKANGVELQQDNNVVAHWTAKQEIGWPILLWLLWLLTAILIIVIAVYACIWLCKLLKSVNSSVKSKSPANKPQRKVPSEKKRNKEEQESIDNFALLCKYYPELKEVFAKLEQNSPDYFKRENYIVERIEKKRFKVCYKYEGEYTKIEMEIWGNEIIAKAGALPGNGRYDGQLNEFLNYPLPNKKYIVDNCFVYETDYMGRVINANADINKSVNLLERVKKGRPDKYPSWVKEMDGTNNDHGGHLFACRLNGPAEKINIIPMDSVWQCRGGDWYENFEEVVYKRARTGEPATPEIKLLYKGKSRRPYAVKVRILCTDEFKTMYNPIS